MVWDICKDRLKRWDGSTDGLEGLHRILENTVLK